MSRVRSPSLTPAISSNRRAPVAQLDRASDSGSEGLRFESGRAHQRFFVGGVNGASDWFGLRKGLLGAFLASALPVRLLSPFLATALPLAVLDRKSTRLNSSHLG